MNKHQASAEQTPIFHLSDEQRQVLLEELGTLLKNNKSLKQDLQQQQERANAEKEALFIELLEVFDALESLIGYMAENPDPKPQFVQKRLPKTLKTIQKKLASTLEQRQVSLIEFQKAQPDFSICQVVDREERNDLEEQTITKVVRQGFYLEDKILRPIEVITSKKQHEAIVSPK